MKKYFAFIILFFIPVIYAQTVSHNASQIKPGVFGELFGGGNYIFPNSVSIGGNIFEAKLVVIGTNSTFIVRNDTNVHLFVNGTTGNVGIGTTQPETPLSVYAPAGDGYVATFYNTLNQNTIIGIDSPSGKNSAIDFYNAGTFIGALYSTSNSIRIYQGNADRLVVSGGNVGIGTSSPTAKLEIQGTGSSLIVRNNTDVHLFVNGTTGNVGIGTTAPTTKLQVHESGNFNSQLTISTNSENYNSILAFTTNASGNPKDARIGLDTANSVLKLVYGAPFASSTNGIMIDSSGRVGIGTSTPTAKLEIQGTGSSLIVRNNTNVHLFVNGTTGNVGIGTINSQGYKLYVDGVIYASGSSKFYKKEIEPLQNTERIYNLTPVSFLYKEEYEHFGKKTGGNKQIGLIAEDVAKYYPELAIFINGYPTNVDYEKLSVVLLAEIQKQNEKINYLENQIKNMNDKKVICNESYN